MTTRAVEPIAWRPMLLVWAVVVAMLYLPQLLHGSGLPPFTDNDDVMRLVTATDLANGQPWQDVVEHRDNTPYGTPMHWSRLVDAPITGLMRLLRPWLGLAQAGNIAALVWPPAMLLGLLFVSVGLTRRLMGPGHQLPALVLPVISIVVLGEFSPHRVDHHNVQMILTTGLAWATISGRTRPWAAIAAGLLTATSLAIGIETLPFIVGAVLAFSLFWVRDPETAGNSRRFALAFAGATLAHFLLATEPSLYFVAACDALSITYVVAAALAAAAIVGATLIGGRLSPARRLALVAAFGLAAIAITLVLFPSCIHGPYGKLNARAVDLLLAHVSEAQPLWNCLQADPATTLSFVIAPFAAMPVLVWCCAESRGETRVDWLVLLAYLVLASIVMVAEIRGARLAVMMAVPAGAWLIARARAAYLAHTGAIRGALLLASWLPFAGIAQIRLPAFVAEVMAKPLSSPVATRMAIDGCFMPHAYDRLASLPPGRVVVPSIMSVHILRYTRDSVVSSGYHRNIHGAFDTDDFLNAGEAAARAVANKRGLNYVVACAGLDQLKVQPRSTPDSFVALWAQHRHWPWLVPLSPPSDAVQIYRIEPAS